MKKQITEKLRFAALVRVSTERQESQGESLLTQESDLQKDVEDLGGEIVAWYGGQEHATPGWEKAQVESLLNDSESKPCFFDAVIVHSPDRWSRDNLASEQGLERLKQSGKRFFIRTSEKDLADPNHRLFLSMSTVIGNYFARSQNEKSLRNRIHRAQRGIPTGGKLPFGRTFDRKTGKWGIDEQKKAMVQEIAYRYLKGESLLRLADEFNLNHTNLHKILTTRCGIDWSLSFKSEDFNIDEVIKITIPRLLDESLISAVREKAVANRTYNHGTFRIAGQLSPYLLSGKIFCSECGYALSGQKNSKGTRYYRHHTQRKGTSCPLVPKPYVRCDEIEESILQQLFCTFGNPQAVLEAYERSTPNLKEHKKSKDRLDKLNNDISSITDSRQTVLNLITKGKLSEEAAEETLDQLRQKELELQQHIIRIEARIFSSIPKDQINRSIECAISQFQTLRYSTARRRAAMKAANLNYQAMTFENKRALIDFSFDGLNADGTPSGVYINPGSVHQKTRRRKWNFELRGQTSKSAITTVMQCASH